MDTTKLSDTELAALSAAHPTLPPEYFAYLRDVGWGEADSGRMIYSGPIAPQDVYGATFNRTDIVLLGDDFQGYGFGYDLTASTYGETTSNGDWQAWPPDKGLMRYVGA
ncbi:hypothetical protein [Lysobacter sp. D1-1-M9]|uniref:hypothetical protein n=1 Tax=Novilysobacter longmucuonensis TaxID=3098603 RepID=UPI002FCBA2F2